MQRVVYPMCELCIHYRKSSLSHALSRCSMFSYLDLRWDNKEYDYADYARRTESKCGKEGRFYKQDTKIDPTKDD